MEGKAYSKSWASYQFATGPLQMEITSVSSVYFHIGAFQEVRDILPSCLCKHTRSVSSWAQLDY